MALNLGSIFYQLGVNTAGLNNADKKVKVFQKNTTNSFNAIDTAANTLKNTLATVISLEALRQSAKLADSFGLMQDRINAVVGDVNRANVTFNRLQAISAKTGAALNVTAGGFQKLQFAKDTIRGTDEEMIRLTQSFAELGMISGTGVQQLDAAMLQFSQGLITGTFQAQEFQSVLENVPAIAPQIAKGMGITVQELIKLKKEGKLVSEDVFRALVVQADEISQKAAEMPIRMSRGFSRLTLGIQQALSKIDEANGITLKLGESLFKAGEQIERFPIALSAGVKTIKDLVDKSEKFQSFVKSIILVSGSMLALTVSTKVLVGLFSVLFSYKKLFFLVATGIAYAIDQTIGFETALKNIQKPLESIKKSTTFLKSIFEDPDTQADILREKLIKLKEEFNKEDDNNLGENLAKSIDNNKPKIVSAFQNIKNEISNIFNSENGLFNFSVDSSQLDIVKSFQENMLTLQTQHAEQMKQITEDANMAEVDQARKKSFALIALNEYEKNTIKSFNNNASRQQITSAGKDFKTQIDLAGQYSKEFFELSKAITIAQLALKTPEAVGNAYTFGTAIGGPPVGTVFGGIALGAMGVQIAAASSATFTPKAVGGVVSPGNSYLVGENGAEILHMGSQRGNIIPNSSLGGMSGAVTQSNNVIVNVHTLPGTNADVQTTENANGDTEIEIFMQQIDAKLSEGIRTGTSNFSQSLQNTFGLNRAAGAAF